MPEHRCAQNADHFAHNSPFSAFFTKVVCVLGAAPPQVAASLPSIGGITPSKPQLEQLAAQITPSIGGNCTIRGTTRRRHAVAVRLMVQNPHQCRRIERSLRAGRHPRAPTTAQANETLTTCPHTGQGTSQPSTPAQALTEKSASPVGYRASVRVVAHKHFVLKEGHLCCFGSAGRCGGASRP